MEAQVVDRKAWKMLTNPKVDSLIALTVVEKRLIYWHPIKFDVNTQGEM